MKLSRHKYFGFTLIEMAFIVILIGVLIGTILPRIVSGIKVDRARDAKAALTETLEEIVGEAITDAEKYSIHELVVPDTVGTDTFVPEPVSGSVDPQDDHSISHRTDPWGQRIHYIVANNQDGNSLAGADALCDATSTDLKVSLNGVDYNNVAFVLISDGKDLSSEFGDATDGTTLERTITGYPYGFTSGSISEYDDIIEFATLDYVKDRVCNASGSSAPDGAIGVITFDDGSGYTNPGGVATTHTMSDGTGQGLVLDLTSSSADDYVVLDSALNYRRHEFTIMGWFRTADAAPTSADDYEPIINRETTSTFTPYNDRNFWMVTWANNSTQSHVPGELVFKASNERGANSGSLHFNHDTNAQLRYTTAGGTLISGSAHHDTKWHFFAAVMKMDVNASDQCTLNGTTTIDDCSTQPYDTQAEYDHTLTLYISDNPDDADLVSTTQSLTTGPELGPNGTTVPGTVWDTYIGREAGNAARRFDGYLDEFTFYSRALTNTEIETYFDSVKANYY